MTFPQSSLDEPDPHRHVDSLFKRTRLALGLVGYAFAFLFTIFQIRHLPIIPLIESIEPDFFIRLSLVLYYNSWVAAITIESRMAQTVYAVDPNRGAVPISMFIVPSLVVLVGLLLILVSSDTRLLSIMLSVLFFLDLLLWGIFNYLARPMAIASEKLYRSQGQYSKIEQLHDYVNEYLGGYWQPYRFIAMASVLCTFLAMSHEPAMRHALAEQLHSLSPTLTAEKIDSLIAPFLFFTYIAIAETWMWIMRLRVKRRIGLLDELRATYALVPWQMLQQKK